MILEHADSLRTCAFYLSCCQALLTKADVNDLMYHNKSLADWVALEIGNLGENMALRRGASLQADEGGHVGYYIHSGCKKLDYT